MSQNKNTNNTLEDFAERIITSSQNAGMVLMAAASTLVLVELGHHGGNQHSAASMQPAYAVANAHGEDPSAMRREKIEETHPHGANSATNQRTAGRTGKA